MSSPFLRAAAVSDSAAIITLIDSVYREYGDQICLTGADSDLADIESHYHRKGDKFIVLVHEGRIIGSHSVVRVSFADPVCTFKRLYLEKSYRGSKLGWELMSWAICEAKLTGFNKVEFWSDSRFLRAHHFFEKFGFTRTGKVRDMTDGSMPYSELHFFRDL